MDTHLFNERFVASATKVLLEDSKVTSHSFYLVFFNAKIMTVLENMGWFVTLPNGLQSSGPLVIISVVGS